MQEYIDLAWKKTQPIVKEIICDKFKSSLNDFDIEGSRVNGELKGFILYKKNNSSIYISEMFFDTEDSKLFYKSFRKITKGIKTIVARISPNNTPLLNATKRLGFKHLGDNKYILVRKAVK